MTSDYQKLYPNFCCQSLTISELYLVVYIGTYSQKHVEKIDSL